MKTRYNCIEKGLFLFIFVFVISPCYAQTDSLKIALRALYKSLDGDNWIRNDNWLSDKPYSEWYGVLTEKLEEEEERPYALALLNNNLNGSLPSDIGMLPSSIVSLNFMDNNITGYIPDEIIKLKTLSSFGIRGNRLEGKLPQGIEELIFFNDAWIKEEAVAQKLGYGIEFEHSLNMIDIGGNFFMHPSLNAVEYRMSREDIIRLAKKEISESIITKKIYSLFKDDFDFINFIYNTGVLSEVSWAGFFRDTKNDIRGIGKSLFDKSREYGSKGRLSGIINMGSRTGGVFKHEFCHNWAGINLGQTVVQNNGQIIPVSAHWGVTDVHGVLGGFSFETLKCNIDGDPKKYQASCDNLSGTFFQAGYSSDKFAPLELYLMGALGIKEVPPVHVYKDVKSFDQSSGIFVAEKVDVLTSTDIQRIYGKRSPSVEKSQKSFSILNVVLTINPVNDIEWDIIQDFIRYHTFKGHIEPEYEYDLRITFWDATGGRITLDMDNLNDKLLTPFTPISNEAVLTKTKVDVMREGESIFISSDLEIRRAELINIVGQVVKTKNVNATTCFIPCRKGIHYIIRIQLEDGSFSVFKL